MRVTEDACGSFFAVPPEAYRDAEVALLLRECKTLQTALEESSKLVDELCQARQSKTSWLGSLFRR